MIYGTSFSIVTEPAAICIGNFDGLHKGHISLINKTIEIGNKYNLKPAVMSFSPHPLKVLSYVEISSILSPREKEFLLSSMDIEYFIEYPFTKEFSLISPEEFVRLLAEKGKCKALIVGEGFRFAKGQSGDINSLFSLGEKYGIKTISVPHTMIGNQKISSTIIRDFIQNNDFESFELFSGRKFFVMGTVEEGKRLGRQIGFPTVNIIPYKNKLLPGDGVYATTTTISNEKYISMSNIGTNPTVSGRVRKIETHIFNYDKVLYGQEINIEFYKYLRKEQNFGSIDGLKKQLSVDAKDVKNYFSRNV